jgi:hypothetical protein
LKNEKENAFVLRAFDIAARSTDAGNTEGERRAYIGSVLFMLTLMKEAAVLSHWGPGPIAR